MHPSHDPRPADPRPADLDATTLLPAFGPPTTPRPPAPLVLPVPGAGEIVGLPRLARHQRHQRRLAAGAGALAATLLVVGCAAGTLGSGAKADPAPVVSADPLSLDAATPVPGETLPGEIPMGEVPTAGGGAEPVSPDDAAEDALDATDDSEGFGDGGQPPQSPDQPDGGDTPVELDPVDQPPVHPCDTLTPGASLAVVPDPVVLPADEMAGSLSIVNCSDGDVDWTAATKPGVDLGSTGANLLPGETVDLGFTIDLDAWDAGAIEFKIKVSEPGDSHYVDVHAYDTLFGSEAVAGGGVLSAGEGVGGCGNQCITSAWLTPNLTTPNVTLDVRTNTPATLRVWVSEVAPTVVDDVPSVPVAPIVVSAAGLESLTTVLQPLDAGTEYHVIVSATDADGDVAHRWTSFTTSTPVELPDGIVSPDGPAGCSLQCITSALLSPGDEEGTTHLAVTSHTDARYQVFVGLEAPTGDDDGGYGMVDPAFWANSGEQLADSWDTTIDGLQPNTLHHVLVTAVDAQGRASYRTGEFVTPAAPLHGTLVMLHRVEVTYDGDSGDWNRGEVSFAWGFADLTVGIFGERKVDDGYVFVPNAHNAWALFGVGDAKPAVFVNTAERDADGLLEFCSGGDGARTEPTHHDGCDISINVASSGIVTDDTIEAMPRCIDLGVEGVGPGAKCTWMQSTIGEGYDTEFRALVSYENF